MCSMKFFEAGVLEDLEMIKKNKKKQTDIACGVKSDVLQLKACFSTVLQTDHDDQAYLGVP